MTKVLFKKKKKTPEGEIIQQLQAKYDSIDESKINKFSDLPLSRQTLKGLTENKFITVTDIQRQSIGLALKGNDILGAAKTGSGKTLAFLIPILEILYCNKWTQLDGLGALIITPTRELAYQIFETVKKVSRYHYFTIGLIIGGKNVKEEKKSMHRCNIIIATPGRLLQHMDENSLFDCVTMKVLVLDEADRCLDMGFEQTMNAIIENLPPERQTLLFSATQTKSVKDLARLSLKNPLYVSVHERATHTTPDGLQQSYIICELEEKISILWSFIRNHIKQKILIFFASCKQVKYIFDAFCRLRPGVSLLVLHGKMNQFKRLEIYNSFCRKERAVLFATDVAARGLDFPAVDWVVQMDCPMDVDTYIHRSGRTARFQKTGESLLLITPNEEPIIDKLKEKKIPINKIQINPSKLQSPQRKLEALLTRDVALKESAQRAVIAYVKTIFLMEDKSIFNVNNVDTAGLARSFGLAVPPRIRFLQRMQKSQTSSSKKETNSYKNLKNSQASEGESEEEETDTSQKQTMITNFKTNKMIDQRDDYFKLPSGDDDDEFLTIKRRIFEPEEKQKKIEEEEEEEDFDHSKSKEKKAVTKAALAKKILKKKIVANKKTNFDEEGQEIIDPTKSKVSELAREYENEEASGINITLAKKIMLEEDRFDKRRYKDILKQRRLEKKKKLKAQRKGEQDIEEGPKVKSYGGNDSATDEEAGSFDSGDESGPDLSWLPDPDKIYGKQKEGEEESDREERNSDKRKSNSEESEVEDEQIHRPPKRKLIAMDKNKQKKKRRSPSVSDNDNLQADEELALQLLRK